MHQYNHDLVWPIELAFGVSISNDAYDEVPSDYYRCVFKTAIQLKNDDVQCNINQTASLLLSFAFNNDYLNPGQLSANGLATLNHAEKIHTENRALSDEIDKQLITCR